MANRVSKNIALSPAFQVIYRCSGCPLDVMSSIAEMSRLLNRGDMNHVSSSENSVIIHRQIIGPL